MNFLKRKFLDFFGNPWLSGFDVFRRGKRGMSQSIQKSLDPPLFRFHQTCNDMHLLGYLPHLAIPKEEKKI